MREIDLHADAMSSDNMDRLKGNSSMITGEIQERPDLLGYG